MVVLGTQNKLLWEAANLGVWHTAGILNWEGSGPWASKSELSLGSSICFLGTPAPLTNLSETTQKGLHSENSCFIVHGASGYHYVLPSPLHTHTHTHTPHSASKQCTHTPHTAHPNIIRPWRGVLENQFWTHQSFRVTFNLDPIKAIRPLVDTLLKANL